jgi:hypothetical protein
MKSLKMVTFCHFPHFLFFCFFSFFFFFSFSRPRSVLLSRPPSSEAGRHLSGYLSELSQMPAVPAKSASSPIVHPPTPFRNTPRPAATAQSVPGVLRLSRKSPDLFSDSEDSEDGSPHSAVSPATAPAYPSVFSERTVSEAATASEAKTLASLHDAVQENAAVHEDKDVSAEAEVSLEPVESSVSIQLNESVSVPRPVDGVQRLEAAISSLAMRQQVEIRKLMDQQVKIDSIDIITNVLAGLDLMTKKTVFLS